MGQFPQESGYEIRNRGPFTNLDRRFVSEENDTNAVYKDVELINEVFGLELEPYGLFRALDIGREVYILNPESGYEERRIPREGLPDSIDEHLEERAEFTANKLQVVEELLQKGARKKKEIRERYY